METCFRLTEVLLVIFSWAVMYSGNIFFKHIFCDIHNTTDKYVLLPDRWRNWWNQSRVAGICKVKENCWFSMLPFGAIIIKITAITAIIRGCLQCVLLASPARRGWVSFILSTMCCSPRWHCFGASYSDFFCHFTHPPSSLNFLWSPIPAADTADVE